LLQRDFQLPSIQLHLHKAIPIGGGLGGGSSDAAATLQLLNTKYNLGISAARLNSYAAQLGSDCPFFMLNKPCYATGRGEVLEEISVDLSAYSIAIVNPRIHVGTKWAFSTLVLRSHKNADLKKLIRLPVNEWKDLIINDFEEPVFTAYPEIAGIKNSLYERGALYASLSGSGSSVYGIFRKDDVPQIDLPGHYFMKWTA
ncbi:MAG TPA: hypothetical protein VK498_15810, partial [Ferruginibacter sp.]|nr:hypothetical protein [Ferruginibacter sp.]